MSKKIIYEITDEKEITFFINTLNNVNQIMKKVNFPDKNVIGYKILNTNFDCEFVCKRSIPREIRINDIYFNSKQQLILDKIYDNINNVKDFYPLWIEDPISLYSFIKEYKKFITSINFIKSNKCNHIRINTSVDENTYYIIENANKYFNDNDFILKNLGKLRTIDLISEFSLKSKLNTMKNVDDSVNISKNIDEFIKKKGIFNLIIDIDDEEIYIDNIPNDNSFSTFIISHKYMTGFSGSDSKNLIITFRIESIENNYKEIDELLKLTIILNKNDKMNVSMSYIIVDV